MIGAIVDDGPVNGSMSAAKPIAEFQPGLGVPKNRSWTTAPSYPILGVGYNGLLSFTISLARGAPDGNEAMNTPSNTPIVQFTVFHTPLLTLNTLVALVTAFGAMAGCRRPMPVKTAHETSPSDQVDATDAPSPPSVVQQIPETPTLISETPWLVVQQARRGTKGGWASGSFLADRNKIVIQTRDVERFSIDTSRLPVNWDRLVVISIDGVNSELRKRDFDVLNFARDAHGAWRVVEP